MLLLRRNERFDEQHIAISDRHRRHQIRTDCRDSRGRAADQPVHTARFRPIDSTTQAQLSAGMKSSVQCTSLFSRQARAEAEENRHRDANAQEIAGAPVDRVCK